MLGGQQGFIRLQMVTESGITRVARSTFYPLFTTIDLHPLHQQRQLPCSTLLLTVLQPAISNASASGKARTVWKAFFMAWPARMRKLRALEIFEPNRPQSLVGYALNALLFVQYRGAR